MNGRKGALRKTEAASSGYLEEIARVHSRVVEAYFGEYAGLHAASVWIALAGSVFTKTRTARR